MPNITEVQAQALREARNIPSEKDRKRRKAALFSEIKSSLRIPSSQKIKVEIDNKSSAYYCALKDGETGDLLNPVQEAYSGARVIERLAVTVATPAPKDAWPYPNGAVVKAGTPARDVKPAMAYDAVASSSHRLGNANAATEAPQLKLGSIAIDDVLKLLRAEADASDSFASATGYADAAVFVKNERLYFVL